MSLLDRLRGIRKGPLAIAGILSAPLFFCALMCSSLAIARPRVVTWTHKGKLISRYHAPDAANELRIWLWALVPFALMIAIGLFASLWRFGAYVSCLAGVVIPLALTHRVPTWELHHAARWPRGIDNIPDRWSSDQVPRGAWEKDAATAAYSLAHWTIGLALTIAIIYTVMLYRRMKARERVALIEAAGNAPTV
jgi:hypothetical protein